LIEKIISGGQTGVDRAALDFAIENGFEHGGYCPQGRRAEDGKISNKYELVETSSPKYIVRTLLNVESADGTLILYKGSVRGGSKAAKDYALTIHKPLIEINLVKVEIKMQVTAAHWIKENQISTLNIAGPRESESNIYAITKDCLEQIFTPLKCDIIREK